MDEVLLTKFEAISLEEDFSSDQYLDNEPEDAGDDEEDLDLGDVYREDEDDYEDDL